LENEIKLPSRENGPPNHFNDKVDSGQLVVNKELSLVVMGDAKSGYVSGG
jgi:hypothetical protein